MAVVINKQKTKVKEAAPVEKVEPVEPSEMSDEDLADLYGSLEDKCQAVMNDPVFVKFAEAKEELQKRLDTYEHDDEIKMKGEHWLVAAGGCSKSPRKVLDNAAIAKMLGNEAFMKVAKVGVGDAEKYLTPEQLKGVVSTEAYTKNRKITASFLG